MAANRKTKMLIILPPRLIVHVLSSSTTITMMSLRALVTVYSCFVYLLWVCKHYVHYPTQIDSWIREGWKQAFRSRMPYRGEADLIRWVHVICLTTKLYYHPCCRWTGRHFQCAAPLCGCCRITVIEAFKMVTSCLACQQTYITLKSVALIWCSLEIAF